MRPVSFHRHAASYFKRLPADRRAQVVHAIETLRPPRPPAELPNVKPMAGEWAGCYRMRVGSLRVIFRMNRQADGAEAVEILQIGPRGDVYK